VCVIIEELPDLTENKFQLEYMSRYPPLESFRRRQGEIDPDRWLLKGALDMTWDVLLNALLPVVDVHYHNMRIFADGGEAAVLGID